VAWCKFADVSDVCAASIIRAMIRVLFLIKMANGRKLNLCVADTPLLRMLKF
jgi:hypothetical protein